MLRFWRSCSTNSHNVF